MEDPIIISSDEDEMTPSSLDLVDTAGLHMEKHLLLRKCSQIASRRHSSPLDISKRIKLDPDIFDSEISEDEEDDNGLCQLENDKGGQRRSKMHTLENPCLDTSNPKIQSERRMRHKLRSDPSSSCSTDIKLGVSLRNRSNSMPEGKENPRSTKKLKLNLDPDIFDNELSGDEDTQQPPVKCEVLSDTSVQSSDEGSESGDIADFICSDNSVEYKTSASEVESDLSDADSDSLPDLENLPPSPCKKENKVGSARKIAHTPQSSPSKILFSSPGTPARIKKKLKLKIEPTDDGFDCAPTAKENKESDCSSFYKDHLWAFSGKHSDSDAASTASGQSAASRGTRHFLDVLCSSPVCTLPDPQRSPEYERTNSRTDENSTQLLQEQIRENKNSSDSESDSDTSVCASDSGDSESDSDGEGLASRRHKGRRQVHCQTKNQKSAQERREDEISAGLNSESDPLSNVTCPVANHLCMPLPRAHCRTIHQPLNHRQNNNNYSRQSYGVTEFNSVQVNTFHALDEETVLVNQTVDLVGEFINSHTQPPREIFNKLLILIMDSTSRRKCYKIYSVLKKAQDFCVPSDSVPFDWVDIETAVTNIRLHVGEDDHMLGSVLALRYMVDMLEDELLSKPLGKQRSIFKSVTSQFISVSQQFDRVKLVLQWISTAVNFGQFESLLSSMSSLQIRSHSGTQEETSLEETIPVIPKVLPILQRLLNLAVLVSPKPDEETTNIATELAHEYTRMPDLFHRKLLITSICSELVKMKVGQRILENNCPNSNNFGCSGNVSLEDIILCYFTYEPPTNSFTPPPTPNGEDEDEDGDVRVVRTISSTRHSSESCEELAMLHYTVVSSYIHCTKGKMTWPLSQRFLRKCVPYSQPLSDQDVETLKSLEAHINSLKSWLSTLTGELNPRTHVYLTQLRCLADIKG